MNHVLSEQEWEQYQKQQAELVQLQQQHQQLQNQLAAQVPGNNNNNNQPRDDTKIPFPIFITPEGKITMTAKVYIKNCNLYFDLKQAQGRVFNGFDKVRLVALHNNQGVVANYLNNVIPVAGTIEATAFNWDTFCTEFIREFTDVNEEQEASNQLSRIQVSKRDKSLVDALHQYHNKMREWKSKLTTVSDEVFKFQYVNKLPEYLSASLITHLKVSDRTVGTMSLNELFGETTLLAKQFETVYAQQRDTIQRSISNKLKYRDSKRDRDYHRDDADNSNVSSINTDADNTNTTGINAMHDNSKRMRSENGGDIKLWLNKIRPYCIDKGLCFRCKQPLSKASDGKLIRHPKGSCQHTELPSNIMQSFQRDQ